jgi:hypothetical protein
MLGTAVAIEPHQALKAALALSTGHVIWMKREIELLEELEEPRARTLVQLYNEERDRMARTAKAAADAGVAEAELELQGRQVEMLTAIVDNAIRAVDGLTDGQRKQFAQALRLEAQHQLPAAPEPPL